ncbi:hypothetical protein F4780DRAFT_417690 [Xylariomycetidae sp. FL0641]|nr:hypothetical protein F4780DRAFT_417690 [Xylariomycetidae sp. FL0641]
MSIPPSQNPSEFYWNQTLAIPGLHEGRCYHCRGAIDKGYNDTIELHVCENCLVNHGKTSPIQTPHGRRPWKYYKIVQEAPDHVCPCCHQVRAPPDFTRDDDDFELLDTCKYCRQAATPAVQHPQNGGNRPLVGYKICWNPLYNGSMGCGQIRHLEDFTSAYYAPDLYIRCSSCRQHPRQPDMNLKTLRHRPGEVPEHPFYTSHSYCKGHKAFIFRDEFPSFKWAHAQVGLFEIPYPRCYGCNVKKEAEEDTDETGEETEDEEDDENGDGVNRTPPGPDAFRSCSHCSREYHAGQYILDDAKIRAEGLGICFNCRVARATQDVSGLGLVEFQAIQGNGHSIEPTAWPRDAEGRLY